jgi:hypothetical protein
MQDAIYYYNFVNCAAKPGTTAYRTIYSSPETCILWMQDMHQTWWQGMRQ